MSAAAGGGQGRRLRVRSLSCRGVKSFVPFQRPPLYAAVCLGGCREKTPADPDGGENPDWDGAEFAFDLNGDGAGDGLLRFEVKAQVPLLGHKLVGTACVPVADLGGGDGAAPRYVSYQVCAPGDKPNGTLSFGYAITGGDGDGAGAGAYPPLQIYPAPNGAPPEQGLSLCCQTSPRPSSAVYPAPATPNFSPSPRGSRYPPPPVSAPLYPPLQDLLQPSNYPPKPPPPPPPHVMNSQYPPPNFAPNSSYPPPATAALATAYPPPPATCTACPPPPAQYISSYLPPPPSNYPPPPPCGYPPPMNQELPASNFPHPSSSYPSPPTLEFEGQEYPVVPRSVDRALPYMAPPARDGTVTYPAVAAPPPPSGGPYYYYYCPPPGTRHPGEAATARTSSSYYPPPGTRYW